MLIASGSGLSYYVDTSSITFHGDGRRAWFRLTFPHHSQRWDDGIKYVAEQSIVVAASPSPPAGTVTYPYSGGFTASGGSPPYTWWASGALPPGLMLGSDGTVSGTPTQIGSFPFSVTATDSAQMPASGPPLATQIVINNPPALALNATPAPPTGVDGVPYGPFSFSVTGGFLPLTWSTTPSSLPPGLSLGTDGSFAGGTERSVIPQGRGGCYVSTLVLSSAELFK